MIKINKGTAPAGLVADCTRLTTLDKIQYVTHTAAYNSGASTFTFTNAYKTTEVKDALMAVHHNKCCFTEAKFVGDSFHVEHFRPKGRVDKWPTGSFSYPGYFWLAYEWSNLYLCKGIPNSSHKRNYFPIMTNVTRNRSHLEAKAEIPYLIDPGVDEPRDHIRFKNEEIVGRSFRGRKTIKILDLRNAQLDEARRTKFNYLNDLKSAVELLIESGSDINDAKIQRFINTLRYSITPQAEFSSMAIDLLSGWRHF